MILFQRFFTRFPCRLTGQQILQHPKLIYYLLESFVVDFRWSILRSERASCQNSLLFMNVSVPIAIQPHFLVVITQGDVRRPARVWCAAALAAACCRTMLESTPPFPALPGTWPPPQQPLWGHGFRPRPLLLLRSRRGQPGRAPPRCGCRGNPRAEAEVVGVVGEIEIARGRKTAWFWGLFDDAVIFQDADGFCFSTATVTNII